MKIIDLMRFRAFFFAVLGVIAISFLNCTGVKNVGNSTNKTSLEVLYDTLHHYIYKNDSVLQRDSVYQRDSIMYVMRGDSVIVDRWHTNYIERWRERIKTDTIYKYKFRDFIKTDTLCKAELMYRKNELTKWQRMRIGLGDLFLFLIVILIIYNVVKMKCFS